MRYSSNMITLSLQWLPSSSGSQLTSSQLAFNKGLNCKSSVCLVLARSESWPGSRQSAHTTFSIMQSADVKATRETMRQWKSCWELKKRLHPPSTSHSEQCQTLSAAHYEKQQASEVNTYCGAAQRCRHNVIRNEAAVRFRCSPNYRSVSTTKVQWRFRSSLWDE